MSTQKDTSAPVSTEATSKQNDISTSTASTGNEIKDSHVDKKDHGKSTGTVEHTTSNASSNAVSSLPVSPTPNFYYANGYADPQTIAAGEYHAAMAAGYDPSDPNVFSAYGHYGMHPSYSQYYPAEYGTGFPGTPPLQGQTSPSLAPQPLSPYFTATSPPIAYYHPTSPQVGPTGIIHSPPMHPYLYSPQSPYGVLHTLSPTLSQSSSSAPNSPPPQYLPGPGVPSPKAGPLNGNGRGSVNRPPHYNYDRRNSGSHQIPNLPNFNNPTKTTNIYIRGLPPNTTDESLHNMCSIYGSITSSKAIIDQKQGDCKGYGFVMYESEDQAKHAIEQLTRLGLQVSFAKVGYESFSTRLKNLQDLASTNIYLSNLPLDMNEQQLEELFKPYKVVSNRILRDTSGTSRGVGFARMEDRDSALAIIQKFNGYQLTGANLPLQVRFADSLAQKKLKGQTAKRRMWRTTREFQSLGGRIIPQVPVTPEHMLGMAAPGSPPGHGAYLQYYSEGVQPPGAYPAGSISPPFGPQYVPRYYQPLYSGPIIHHGTEGQMVAADTSAPNPPETIANNDVPLIVTSDPTEELSELVQKKLNVDGGENDAGAEGVDTK
ncbi:23869_t:CDS:2 [Dentiscutata erythropus]|uniref:23869_t:CDS:1 n=1 Tax=Dentiscutata erythropus TaxID=1348616 RepID=A0A9N9EJ39_9GLOM|nr:23869_t:CDS:2 [Dentiscutata erythropus]